jgi:hypothetical protein
MMHKLPIFFLLLALSSLLSACQRNNFVCPTEYSPSESALELSELASIIPTPGPTPAPISVEINGKMVLVDRVVEGPLCNDSWYGKVYVDCGVQVAQWTEEPLFFKGCNLDIEPGTVVYVAAHNNEAYYKGCSCHTGELGDQ